MTGVIDQRLIELDLELPNPAAPAANYVPYVVSGSLVFVSGQITAWNGEIKHTGIVGDNRTLEDGSQAARICGLNLIAQVKEACGGDLDRVRRGDAKSLCSKWRSGPSEPANDFIKNQKDTVRVANFPQSF